VIGGLNLKKVLVVLLVLTASTLIYFVVADINYTPNTEENTGLDKYGNQNLKEDEYQEPGLNEVQNQIEHMTLDEKIGQLFIAGIEGPTLTDYERDKFERNALGGAILFSNNLEEPEQSIELINDLKQMETVNNVPMFLSVDQEGGQVTRLPALDPIKSAEEVGETNDPTFAFKQGQLIGNHLKDFGFQVDFAPVLDINSNPDNPVIGDRAFGDDPDFVYEMGIQMMKGLQDQHIITAIKHFPGHGDTEVDSHVDLPYVYKTREELDDNELIPFKKAIESEANVDMVLVAHIMLPELDEEVPASMSKDVVDILREEWKYDGVVITDDLTMGAITENYPMDEAAVKAFQAGVDILLIAHGEENLDEGIDGIKEAIQQEEISEERLDESVTRILELKEEYNLNNDPIEDVSIDEMNKEIEQVYDKN